MSGWLRYRGRPGAIAGLVGLGIFLVVAAAADLLASDLPLAARVDGRFYLLPCLTHPRELAADDAATLSQRAEWLVATPLHHGPLAVESGSMPLTAPSPRHLLGTDGSGRDVAARLVHGTRTALAVGATATLLFVLGGLLVGAACAMGPRADLLLGRLIEIGSAVPAYFLLLAVQAAALVRGDGASVVEVAAAIAITRWPEVARITRAEALRVSTAPHVEAARAIGLPPLAIALRHVLPLAAGPALVSAAIGVGQAVLLETGLSFLGCGVPPPVPSWGQLLAEAHSAGMPAHLVIAPALAIALLVMVCGRIADGLRALLDPREA